MNPIPRISCLTPWCRLATLAIGVLLTSLTTRAQPAPTGTIEGRVFDAGRGEYLEKARLVIASSAQETFTEAGGQYRFTNVPAGVVEVRVFFTGLVPQTHAVTVTAGQTVQFDVTLAATPLGAARRDTADQDTVKLDRFVVSTSKEMDGAAIAINEQRFARNIMNVIAADEFGTVVDGTPGEVLKFLPGITMDYSAGEARTISMNGVPADNVPITVGGFELASAAGNGTRRVTNLDQFSVNSIARIEVMHSPTPESTGSALAGSVNMVPRSAFERSRPSYTGSVFLMMKDGEKQPNKTPGPMERSTYKITPGYNFNAIVPVNKRFGFTLSGNYADQYSYENVATSSWRGVGSVTNAAATATTGLPDTTPDNPYLTDFALRDSTRDNRTYSVGLTADYKLTRNDTLSLSFQYTFIGVLHNNRTFTFFVGRVLPGQWGPTFTHGAPAVRNAAGVSNGFGEVRVQGSAQDWLGTTSSPSLVWRHEGLVWKAQAGAGLSRASLHVRSVDKGFFRASQARRTGVVVSFDDDFYLRPGTVTVKDGEGRPVDPYNLANFSLVSADDNPRDTADLKRSVYANLRRDFEVRDVPVSLKGGLDLRSSQRDLRGFTKTYTFVGADGRASTTPVGNDDSAAVVLDESFSQRPGSFGFPSIQQLSNQEYWRLYQEHPEYFTINESTFYRTGVTQSKRAEEVISSAYLRGDLAFFHRRLQFVGGLRAEQTNIRAEGPLVDTARNFQRNPDGSVIFATPGRPALITTDALAASQLTYVDRGQHNRKEYLRFFPNLNVSLNLRENLVARAAYYQSVGRPDFNQYAGGVALPDTQTAPSTSNRITINNPAIKAWTAETVKVRFEYYFERVGQVSIGGFRRDFTSFFGSTVFNATPEFLEANNLESAVYDPYDVTIQYNLPGHVIMSGLEFDYKQALTFLPAWARGVQVFANASAQRATGEASDNFSGYVPRSGSWGISLTRPKYLLRANWNYRGRQRLGIVATGRGIDPSTYNWGSKRLYLDVTGEYNFFRRFTLFANLRNLQDVPQDTKIYGPNTPDYAKFRQRIQYGSAWTFGLRGAF